MGRAPRDESLTYQGNQFTAGMKGKGGGLAAAQAFPAMSTKGSGTAQAYSMGGAGVDRFSMEGGEGAGCMYPMQVSRTRVSPYTGSYLWGRLDSCTRVWQKMDLRTHHHH